MSRCKIPVALTKNAMAALSENGQRMNYSSTPNVFDKTKEVLSNAATAVKDAATATKEKIEDVVGDVVGQGSKHKTNAKIENAKELAKDDYVNREKSNQQYGPGSFGEKIQEKEQKGLEKNQKGLKK